MSTGPGLRAATAILAALALSLGPVARADAAPASPAPAPASPASPSLAAPAAAIDPARTGAITVHDLDGQPSTVLPHDGTSVSTGLPPVAGAAFTAWRIDGIDLGTNAGWAAAAALGTAFDPADPFGSIRAAGLALGAPASETTGADGRAAFTGLALGAYLVAETSYPAGASPVQPFVVTVPMTDPAQPDRWRYAVDVYPKAFRTTAIQTLSDGGATAIGETISIEVTATIPALPAIDGYRIVDPLDAALDYRGASMALLDRSASGGLAVPRPAVALADGGDYTIAYDPATRRVTAQFTPAGLAVLAAHADQRIRLTIQVGVNGIGVIPNVAYVYPNLASFALAPGSDRGALVTAAAVTGWGGITVEKTDPAGARLAGATFAVYRSEADATARRSPIALGGADAFTTGADGTVVLRGLRYSALTGGQTVTPETPGYHTYWLAELTAPAGFARLSRPIAFTIDAATTSGVRVLVVRNARAAAASLPFTGVEIGGAVIAAGVLGALGVLLVVAARRRRRAEDEEVATW